MKITVEVEISDRDSVHMDVLNIKNDCIKTDLSNLFAKELVNHLSLDKKPVEEMAFTKYRMDVICFNLSTASRIFAILNEQHLSLEVIKELKEIFIKKI